MTHTHAVHDWFTGFGHFLEHGVAVIVGLILMILGLGLSVTMIMLPVGLAIGLLGMGLFIGGLFANLDERG